MSAKFLQGFTDENPELQRQIGCMTGIFQMFDRQHLLTGRRLNAQKAKRPPSGHALLTGSNFAAENSSHPQQRILEKKFNKSINEDQRAWLESSRTSFSSSSSSSFSSMDCSKSTQQDPSFNEQDFCSDKSLKHLQKRRNSQGDSKLIHPEPSCDPVRSSIQSGRQLLDFRDVVKDSIYRDNHALTLKTSIQEGTKKQPMKHNDSPRPLQLSNSVDESLCVLVKVRESPPRLPEAYEPPRKSYEGKDGSFYQLSKGTPRFSFDGREWRPSLDSRDKDKPSSNLRELPRLSLDSRASSLKNSTFNSKPNTVFMDLDRKNMNRRNSLSLEEQQELRSNVNSPSVVVKLMGLEGMPNYQLGSQGHAHSTRNKDLEKMGSSKLDSKVDLTAPSANYTKAPVAPKHKSYLIMKPISNTRVPIEVAPWRQQDKIGITQKTTYECKEGHARQQSESVYSKIEKRMKYLESQQSNKDFRALKQILDSIKKKGLLESKRGEGQPTEALACHHSPDNSQSFRMNDDEFTHQMLPTVKKGEKSPRASESLTVIMKPVKTINSASMPSKIILLDGLSSLQGLRISDPAKKMKTLTGNKMTEDQTPKASSTARPSQHIISKDKKIRKEENDLQKSNLRVSKLSYRLQESTRENNGISMRISSSPGPQENNGRTFRSSNSNSPRLLQRKLETEKRSKHSLPSADSNKPQKQIANRQSSDSVSPRVRSRQIAAQEHENDDQYSDISSEGVKLSHRGDEISQRSDSNISLASQMDIKLPSADSTELKPTYIQQGCESPGRRAEPNLASVLKSKKSLHSSIKSAKDMETAAPEHPSPISVLDASICRDSVSPHMRKHHHGLKGNENLISNSNKLKDVPGISSPELDSRFNHKKFANIEDLIQKLRQLSESNNEAPATDHITLLCETQNPDDHYVSEILLASGLLMKDLTCEHLDPTEIPINPDLFLVLEQRKSSWLAKPEATKEKSLKLKSDPERLHRRLIFDIVNELLTQKLELATPVVQINSAMKTRNIRLPSGQCLLKELCSDIEKLKMENSSVDRDRNSIYAGDMLRQSEGWTDFVMESPVLVLEIERLIFKDLIEEVVTAAAATSFQEGKRKAQS